MNQRSSAMTARRKTRFVVTSGSTGIGGDDGSDEGRDREKRRAGGAKTESVPVPVLCGGELDQNGSSKTIEHTYPGDARRSQGCSESGQGIGIPRAVATSHYSWVLRLSLTLS